MAASLKLLPGSTVRWRGRRYLIVDYQSLDAIIARQPGRRRLERIPVNEAAPDHASHIVSGRTPDLASVPEKAWQTAVKRFEILKPLLNMGNSERTFVHVKKAARALGKHPATVYRWIENYGRSERLSVFLRKERSDRGTTRLATTVEQIITKSEGIEESRGRSRSQTPFANSIATFAFISARSARIRRYLWN